MTVGSEVLKRVLLHLPLSAAISFREQPCFFSLGKRYAGIRSAKGYCRIAMSCATGRFTLVHPPPLKNALWPEIGGGGGGVMKFLPGKLHHLALFCAPSAWAFQCTLQVHPNSRHLQLCTHFI